MQVSDRFRQATADLTGPVAVFVAVVPLQQPLLLRLWRRPVSRRRELVGRGCPCSCRCGCRAGWDRPPRKTQRFDLAVSSCIRCGALWAPRRHDCLRRICRGTLNSLYRTRSYLSTRALTGAAAAGAAAAVAAVMSAGVGEIIAAATIGALVAELLDAGFASTTHRLRGNGRWIDAAGSCSQ